MGDAARRYAAALLAREGARIEWTQAYVQDRRTTLIKARARTPSGSIVSTILVRRTAAGFAPISREDRRLDLTSPLPAPGGSGAVSPEPPAAQP
jgi:hypothetical protein